MLKNFVKGSVYGRKYVVVVTSLAQILFPIVKEIKYPHKKFSVKHKTMPKNFVIGSVHGSKYVVVTSLAQILFPIVKEIKYPHKFFSVKHKTMLKIFVIGSVLGKSSRPASVRSC